MIRLGTTFSGIGAVEHALERLNIKHEIVFACDNGGVDIFYKKIEDRFKSINDEIIYLKQHIKKLDLENIGSYKDTLFRTLYGIEDTFKNIIESTQQLDEALNLKHTIMQVLAHLEKIKIKKFAKYFDTSKLDISDYLYLSSDLKNYIKKEEKKLNCIFIPQT